MTATDLRVTMMLCDHAQVADGKLFIAGGGWNVTGPAPTESAVAMLISVPWDRANSLIQFTLKLITDDGQSVVQSSPAGDPVPVQIAGSFEVGRPPGLPPGASIELPFGLNIPPIPLPPGQRFSWELTLNGDTHEDWRLSFSTRPAQSRSGPPGPTPVRRGHIRVQADIES